MRVNKVWSRGGGRIEPPTKFSKRGYLIGPQLLKVTKKALTCLLDVSSFTQTNQDSIISFR